MDLHQRLARWMRERPHRVDALLAAALWLLLVVPGAPSEPEYVVVTTALLAPVAVRRRRPVASAAAVAVVCLLQWTLGIAPAPAQIAVPIVVSTAAAHGSRTGSRVILGVGLAGAVLAAVPGYIERWTGVASPVAAAAIFLISLLTVLVAWTFGDLARTRRLRMAELTEANRRLRVEREQERALAAADERTHIAREMHDVIAHSLTVMITQADGARYASAQHPEAAPQALETIAETGRASLREMRRLLGVLRAGADTGTRPTPTLGDVPDLVATIRASGLLVELRTAGSARATLAPGAELTAYRVVQEGLTNVLKHAGSSATARVELTWDAAGLTVCVDDDGRGAAALDSTVGARQGLVGMAERVRLYDGVLRAGPTAAGFRVRATLPYPEG